MTNCKSYILTVALASLASASVSADERYFGPCDASAAAAISDTHFVLAEDDENVLYVYQRGIVERPKKSQTVSLSEYLGTGKKESDLEGSARIGNRIYWISSHGRNKDGEERPLRYRFFATDIVSGSAPTVEPVGKPYAGLLGDLLQSKQLSGLPLSEASLKAPEAPGGLNIEGLAATPDGQLLIGLRNPVPDGKAVLIPFTNPSAVITGSAAEFGPPQLVDLGGRGIRSIELVGSEYYIAAGPTADSGTFALYRLPVPPKSKATLVTDANLGTLRPEAIFAWPNSKKLQLISDDGGAQPSGKDCKKTPKSERGFRSMTFDLK